MNQPLLLPESLIKWKINARLIRRYGRLPRTFVLIEFFDTRGQEVDQQWSCSDVLFGSRAASGKF